MRFLPEVADTFSRWIDSVAETINSLADRFQSRRRVQLLENEDATFTLRALDNAKTSNLAEHRVNIENGRLSDTLPADWTTVVRGSRMELILRPARFLFRPLELPKRATEFLDGIIRAQIDRLTPWTANEAVYHWTAPTDIPNDRIHLLIAATARTMVAPYLLLAANLGAASIVISTIPQDSKSDASHIKIFEQRAHAAVEIGRVRRILLAVFFLTGLAALASIGFSAVVAGNLDAEQQQLSKRIAERRAVIRAGLGSDGRSPQRMLEVRKQATPSSVIVLEALSQLLPDHTYVTEVRIEGDKVQVVGITQDAPSLIQLMEQSPQFTRATFFAPTTRSSNDPGERFHIEARIKPYFPSGT
jgi:general secretion pathway protein L